MNTSNRFFFLAVLVFLFAACNQGSDNKLYREDGQAEWYSWEATLNDSSGNLQLQKRDDVFPDTLNPGSVIRFLNNKNPFIQLQYRQTHGDTLFVAIPEATYLTQQSGSAGPVLFFAEAVYNLTEIPGVRFVYFDFDEGDHAQPGTLSREDFKDQ